MIEKSQVEYRQEPIILCYGIDEGGGETLAAGREASLLGWRRRVRGRRIRGEFIIRGWNCQGMLRIRAFLRQASGRRIAKCQVVGRRKKEEWSEVIFTALQIVSFTESHHNGVNGQEKFLLLAARPAGYDTGDRSSLSMIFQLSLMRQTV